MVQGCIACAPSRKRAQRLEIRISSTKEFWHVMGTLDTAETNSDDIRFRNEIIEVLTMHFRALGSAKDAPRKYRRVPLPVVLNLGKKSPRVHKTP